MLVEHEDGEDVDDGEEHGELQPLWRPAAQKRIHHPQAACFQRGTSGALQKWVAQSSSAMYRYLG